MYSAYNHKHLCLINHIPQIQCLNVKENYLHCLLIIIIIIDNIIYIFRDQVLSSKHSASCSCSCTCNGCCRGSVAIVSVAFATAKCDCQLHNVCLSVCPHENLGSCWTHFREHLHWGFSLKFKDTIWICLMFVRKESLYKFMSLSHGVFGLGKSFIYNL